MEIDRLEDLSYDELLKEAYGLREELGERNNECLELYKELEQYQKLEKLQVINPKYKQCPCDKCLSFDKKLNRCIDMDFNYGKDCILYKNWLWNIEHSYQE